MVRPQWGVAELVGPCSEVVGVHPSYWQMGSLQMKLVKIRLQVWALIQDDWCPYKQRIFGHTQVNRRMSREHEGKYQDSQRQALLGSGAQADPQ